MGKRLTRSTRIGLVAATALFGVSLVLGAYVAWAFWLAPNPAPIKISDGLTCLEGAQAYSTVALFGPPAWAEHWADAAHALLVMETHRVDCTSLFIFPSELPVWPEDVEYRFNEATAILGKDCQEREVYYWDLYNAGDAAFGAYYLRSAKNYRLLSDLVPPDFCRAF